MVRPLDYARGKPFDYARGKPFDYASLGCARDRRGKLLLTTSFGLRNADKEG